MKFMGLFLAAALIPGVVFSGSLKGNWELGKSELTYKVTHPLHKVNGKSTAARGKGICGAKGCEFLVAVPVKSFDSGDGNRDSHMWQTVKAGTYPMIQVHITGVESLEKEGLQEIIVEAEVEFAGKKVTYSKVKLQVTEWKKEGVRLKGILPLSLKAFEIKAPSLLTLPVEDLVPVELDMFWKNSGL